jgi:uncharacterized protein (TIGR03435 family)
MNGQSEAMVKMRGVTMAGASQFFARNLLHPVADETGIAGTFDIDLPVAVGMPDGWLDPAAGAGAAAPPPPPAPPMLTPAALAKAVETLGLKLETRRGPVEYLVVESADRTPTAN